MKPEELLKEEYIALRSEICQSIAKQHQITLAGYALVSAATGYMISASHWRALIAIPPLFIAMAALWAVECNRMVRAGYYIGYVLWPEICVLVGRSTSDGWETWIRLSEGNEGSFRKWQHLFQSIVIILIPLILSLTAILISAKSFKENIICFSVWPFVLYIIILFIIWGALYLVIRRISNLAGVIPDYSPKAKIPNKPMNQTGL
jgi:hypothetical protein